MLSTRLKLHTPTDPRRAIHRPGLAWTSAGTAPSTLSGCRLVAGGRVNNTPISHAVQLVASGSTCCSSERAQSSWVVGGLSRRGVDAARCTPFSYW